MMKEHPAEHGINAIRALAKDVADHGDPVEGARYGALAKKMAEEIKGAEEMLAARIAKRAADKADADKAAGIAPQPAYEASYSPAAKVEDEPAKRKAAR